MTQEWTIPIQIRVSIGAARLAQDFAPPERGRDLSRRAVRADAGAAFEAADTFNDRFSKSSLTKQTFDWGTALSLALAARLAYGDAAAVTATAKNTWGLPECEFVEADDTQCFVAASADAVLVSFRGTAALGDWLANLNLLATTRPYGEVHRGFLGAFQVVEQRLASILDQFPKRRLLLTGHSLGGALAVIAAAEWRDRYKVSWLHTFGQPAVGKASFQKFMEIKYGDTYYRFVNDDDIVPRVPPFFRHAGRLIHFDADGDLERVLGSAEMAALEIELDPVPAETPMLSPEQFDLLRARLLQERALKGGALLSEANVERAATEAVTLTGEEGLEGFFPSVSDHSIDLYVAKVARKAGF